MTSPSSRTLFAIDPGPEMSAFVVYDGNLLDFGYCGNREMLHFMNRVQDESYETTLVIEQIKAMGMAVGAEVFETVFWSGRFAQAWTSRGVWDRIGRIDVKLHLCGSARAKDGNVRQALIDRFSDGKGEKAAKGTKKEPGPLYGVSGDVWAALAVAVTYYDTRLNPKLAAIARAVGETDQTVNTLTRKE
jgi:hypothetical protein